MKIINTSLLIAALLIASVSQTSAMNQNFINELNDHLYSQRHIYQQYHKRIMEIPRDTYLKKLNETYRPNSHKVYHFNNNDNQKFTKKNKPLKNLNLSSNDIPPKLRFKKKWKKDKKN